MVTKTDAKKRFGVSDADLESLKFFSKTSSQKFVMKLYLVSQLESLVAARSGNGSKESGNDPTDGVEIAHAPQTPGISSAFRLRSVAPIQHLEKQNTCMHDYTFFKTHMHTATRRTCIVNRDSSTLSCTADHAMPSEALSAKAAKGAPKMQTRIDHLFVQASATKRRRVGKDESSRSATAEDVEGPFESGMRGAACAANEYANHEDPEPASASQQQPSPVGTMLTRVEGANEGAGVKAHHAVAQGGQP